MKFLSCLFLLHLLGLGSAYAQSNLRACPSSGNLNDCFGSYTYPNNWRYVGEWKDNRQNGQGTLYAVNGSVLNQGVWADGKFVRSAPVLQANSSSVLTSSAERGRLAAVSNLPACPASGCPTSACVRQIGVLD